MHLSLKARNLSKKSLTLCAICTLFLFVPQRADGYLLVEDIPNLTHNIVSQITNYVQYVYTASRELIRVEQGVAEIANQVTALRRFGEPAYYTNLLGLDRLTNSIIILRSGIGNTISQYRQISSGTLALSYTGSGLYDNLTGTVDRFGNQVRYDTSAFRKFSTVNNMVEGYNTQQTTYNAQMAQLQQDLQNAIQNLNASSDHMSTQKYAAQIAAISAQMNALGHTTTLTGQRADIQHLANQSDYARVEEAHRQEEIQERSEDLRAEASGFSKLIGAP